MRTHSEHAPEMAGSPKVHSNQMRRTRTAIIEAARALVLTGAAITMPGVAKSALVSEATAYRYFPDLSSLLQEALRGTWPEPPEAMAPVADSVDPVERIGFATEFLMRRVLTTQGAVRAMIAATITRPELATRRPGFRFGLIDLALTPIESGPAGVDPSTLAQLKQDLSAILSAEVLFTLTDLCGLSPDDAVASAVRTARTLTRAAIQPLPARSR